MLLFVFSKTADSLPPRRNTAAMIAMAISETSRPYSTADAPRSVLARAVNRMRRYSMASIMVFSPLSWIGPPPLLARS
jgi:hypothetical protein